MSKKHRIYFGRKFYRDKKEYWVSTTLPLIHAHRWVWINHNGDIPKGMDIHHIDEDKSNNEIENLQIINRSDHLKIHWKDENDRLERRKFLDDIRHKVHEWLRSEEGRKKQSEGAIEGWKKRRSIPINCIQCANVFNTFRSDAKFCTNACDKKWRRKQSKYKIEAKCMLCDNVYLKDKFTKQKFCSVACRAKNFANVRSKINLRVDL